MVKMKSKKSSWGKTVASGISLWKAFQTLERPSHQHSTRQKKWNKIILLSGSIVGGLLGAASIMYLLSSKSSSKKKSLALFHWHPFSSNGHKH